MTKVLIVEDDQVLRDVYKEMFEREGFEIAIASDGEAGINMATEFFPHVILLDVMMPKMSGFDVVKNLKSNQKLKGTPIIVLTNLNIDSQDLVQNWGVSYVMLKVKHTPGEVVEKVKEVLQSSSSRSDVVV